MNICVIVAGTDKRSDKTKTVDWEGKYMLLEEMMRDERGSKGRQEG